MDVSRKVLVAYLEEDNEQKVFFRLLPLLDEDGPVREDAIAQWPAQGGLRIVPDKNELYHFKDRMRALGSFCLMDLTRFPPEANKIRTNKNYSPERGEINQFIIYSDTISPLPKDMCFEVAEADSQADAMAALAALATPMGYVRMGDGLYGPLGREAQSLGEGCTQLPQERLFSLECPDGVVRTFFWPRRISAQPAAPQAAAQEETLEIGRPLTILDQTKDFNDQLKAIAQPLSSGANLLHAAPAAAPAASQPVPQLTGTPLYRSVSSKPAGPRAHNPLHQVVETQWRAAKYEAPSAQIKQGAALHHVDNPVERCREALHAAWDTEAAQEQVLDSILALPGMTRRLEKALLQGAGDHPLQAAIRLEIQELEAERLALLVQLDKAKERLASFREEALNGLTQAHKDKVEASQRAVIQAESQLAALRKELNALIQQRDALEKTVLEWQSSRLPAALAAAISQAKYLSPLADPPLRLTVLSGDTPPAEALIDRLTQACSVSRDDAANWLVLLALCPRIQLVQPKLGDSLAFLKSLCAALGLSACLAYQESERQQPLMSAPSLSPTPALLATPYLQPAGSDPLMRTLLLTESSKVFLFTSAYRISPWPILYTPDKAPGWQSPQAVISSPIAMEALAALLRGGAELSKAEAAFMQSLYDACAPLKASPCTTAFETMAAYLKAAAPLLSGGFAGACDYACRQWLLPAALESRDLAEALHPVLAGLPCAAQLG